ncbi:MAG: hypothetical protein ACP5ON_10980 [Bacteroidota bacterium]
MPYLARVGLAAWQRRDFAVTERGVVIARSGAEGATTTQSPGGIRGAPSADAPLAELRDPSFKGIASSAFGGLAMTEGRVVIARSGAEGALH